MPVSDFVIVCASKLNHDDVEFFLAIGHAHAILKVHAALGTNLNRRVLIIVTIFHELTLEGSTWISIIISFGSDT